MRYIKPDKKLIFIFAIYLYPIILKNAVIPCYGLIYGIPFIYMFARHKALSKYLTRINTGQWVCIIGICFLILMSILQPIISHTSDFSYLMATTYIFRKMYIYVFLSLLIIIKYREKASLEIFMYYFCVVTSAYVFFTIFFFLFPQIKHLWITMLTSSEKTSILNNTFGYSFRFGWQGFAGYRLTLNCSLSVIFCLFLYLDKRSSYIMKRSAFIIILSTSLLGNMFYGRIGVLVSAICLFVALVFLHKLSFKMISSTVAFIAIGVIFLLLMKKSTGNLYEWYIWMSTPFRNLIKTGSFQNASVNALLKDMIFLPDYSTIIFGDGYYTNPIGGGYYMSTDSGIMRQVLFWGIFMTGVSYIITLKAIMSIGHRYRLLCLLLIIAFVFFEIKGEIYYEFLSLMLPLSILRRWYIKESGTAIPKITLNAGGESEL